MGEAAYNEAKAKGELIEQKLRRLSKGYAGDFDDPPTRLDLVMNEAADIIEWLSKERDALIEQEKHADECWRAQCEENEALASKLDKVREWLACSPMSERISERRCEELLLLVGGPIKARGVETREPT